MLSEKSKVLTDAVVFRKPTPVVKSFPPQSARGAVATRPRRVDSGREPKMTRDNGTYQTPFPRSNFEPIRQLLSCQESPRGGPRFRIASEAAVDPSIDRILNTTASVKFYFPAATSAIARRRSLCHLGSPSRSTSLRSATKWASIRALSAGTFTSGSTPTFSQLVFVTGLRDRPTGMNAVKSGDNRWRPRPM